MALIVGFLAFALVMTVWVWGRWFGRVAVFLALCGLVFLSSSHDPMYLVIGLPLAWIIASVPMWVWKRRGRVTIGPPSWSATRQSRHPFVVDV